VNETAAADIARCVVVERQLSIKLAEANRIHGNILYSIELYVVTEAIKRDRVGLEANYPVEDSGEIESVVSDVSTYVQHHSSTDISLEQLQKTTFENPVREYRSVDIFRRMQPKADAPISNEFEWPAMPAP
jgi:hypothetical protein